MKKILVVVDMQNDFIDGALGTPEACSIVANVKNRIDSFEGDVVFTRDTHGDNYTDTQEGKMLPVPHCIKGTYGWEITDRLDVSRAVGIVDKTTFGSIELAWMLKDIESEIQEVVLVGLCTDICVVSNAILLKAALPETKITVDAACCAGVTPETHEKALSTLKMCQINVENF